MPAFVFERNVFMTERTENGVCNALKIGVSCICIYMMSYCIRNLLTVSSAEILKEGALSKERLGFLSAMYYGIYAFGQLINGAVGDVVTPKKMVMPGLLASGIASCLFPFASNYIIQLFLFGIMGFGLSMLRGPLVKIISENMQENHARLACVLLAAGVYAGPFVVSFAAVFLKWTYVFLVFGIVTVICAFFGGIVLDRLEKSKVIIINISQEEGVDFLSVFRIKNFAVFVIISAIVEVAGTSISFWIPSYVSERLKLSVNLSNMAFCAISMIKFICPFLCLVILKLFKDNMMRLMRVLFLVSALGLALMNFVPSPILNITIFAVSQFLSAGVSALIWSVYIPSLADTGKVSAVNGILDFSGYFGASAANVMISSVMGKIGWNGVVYMWSLFMFLGFAVAVYPDINDRKQCIKK